MPITKKGINEEISLEAHRILNKVKADKDFKDKGEALNYIILEYGKEHKLLSKRGIRVNFIYKSSEMPIPYPSNFTAQKNTKFKYKQIKVKRL